MVGVAALGAASLGGSVGAGGLKREEDDENLKAICYSFNGSTVVAAIVGASRPRLRVLSSAAAACLLYAIDTCVCGHVAAIHFISCGG